MRGHVEEAIALSLSIVNGPEAHVDRLGEQRHHVVARVDDPLELAFRAEDVDRADQASHARHELPPHAKAGARRDEHPEDSERDRFFDAKQAVAYGICDEVIGEDTGVTAADTGADGSKTK